MRGKQGFHFYDKQLRISFAKESSKRVAAKLGLPVLNNDSKNNSSIVEELGKRKFNSSNSHKHFDDDSLNTSV